MNFATLYTPAVACISAAIASGMVVDGLHRRRRYREIRVYRARRDARMRALEASTRSRVERCETQLAEMAAERDRLRQARALGSHERDGTVLGDDWYDADYED